MQITEQLLDNGLGIIKGPIDSNIKDIGISNRGHLEGLNRTGPSMRMEDKDIDPLSPPHPVDGRTAGITGSSTNDIHKAAAFFQLVLKQIPEQLQGHVLKGQGRAVKELHDIEITGLAHRSDLGMPEGAIGPFNQIVQIKARHIAGEQVQHLQGKALIMEILPGIQLLR